MICKNCENEFSPSKNDKRIKFCSEKCRCEYRKKNGYMKKYYEENIEKWKETQSSIEHKEKKNLPRNERYRQDKEYRDLIKKRVREYNKRNPKVKLNQHLREYGITIEDYDTMLKSQDYKCAICRCSIEDLGEYKYRPLFIDHNHKTGKIRGLLCNNCNFILGHAKDDISILENAIKYLKESDGD